VKKTGNTKLARRSVAIVGMLGCVVFIVPAALTADAYTAVYCLTGAGFFLECTIGPSWAVPMDTGGKYCQTADGDAAPAGAGTETSTGGLAMTDDFVSTASRVSYGLTRCTPDHEAPFSCRACRE